MHITATLSNVYRKQSKISLVNFVLVSTDVDHSNYSYIKHSTFIVFDNIFYFVLNMTGKEKSHMFK